MIESTREQDTAAERYALTNDLVRADMQPDGAMKLTLINEGLLGVNGGYGTPRTSRTVTLDADGRVTA